MSHSLHRRGCKESLKDDFVILITPSVGINHENSGPMLWKILDIITDVGPNNIGSYETGTIYTGVTIEQIKESMPETPRVRCCFDSKEKMFEVLKRIKKIPNDFGVFIGPDQFYTKEEIEKGIRKNSKNLKEVFEVEVNFLKNGRR